jgi:Tfp pilus assembly protein PilX
MKPNQLRPKNRKGFALIVTLILLMLITVIAIGLLSLSSTSLRASGTALARSQAQANARMALSLAIGQLQKTTGPDQRITASADFVNPAAPQTVANRNWVGVWRSDETDPTTYPTARSDKFLEWLVTNTGKTPTTQDANTTLSGDFVAVRRITGEPDVNVPLAPTADGGRLAWWTEDESLKARANMARETQSSIGEKLVAAHIALPPQPEAVLGGQGSAIIDSATKAVATATPAQLSLASEEWPEAITKDFTTYSRSLITDVKNGGLKQDLNTLFEQDYAVIRKNAGMGQWFGSGTTRDESTYLYGRPRIALGARWNMLYHYYKLYKEVSLGSVAALPSSDSTLRFWTDSSGPADDENFLGDPTVGYRSPRLLGVSYVIYSTGATRTTATDLVPTLGYKIYATIWNPFDTQLYFPPDVAFSVRIHFKTPAKISGITSTGRQLEPTQLESLLKLPNRRDINFGDPGAGLTLAPGETATFTMTHISGDNYRFIRGFDATPATVIRVNDPVTALTLPWAQRTVANVEFRIQGDLNKTTAGGSDNNHANLWELWYRKNTTSDYEARGRIVALDNVNYSEIMPLTSVGPYTGKLMFESFTADPEPILAFTVKARVTGEQVVNLPNEPAAINLTTGVAALAGFSGQNPNRALMSRFEFGGITSTGIDSILANVNGGTGAYVGQAHVSGVTSYAPVSLPKVPPTSLAQFRHAGTGDSMGVTPANLSNEGTIIQDRSLWNGSVTPPVHADQAIGNSYASPLIPRGATQVMGPEGYEYYDHRYLGNQALWDKYFLSSLAPLDASKFGTAKTMISLFEDFAAGNGKLLNPRFSAWLGGQTVSDAKDDLFDGATLKPEAYRLIASKLIYEGGFNVNSTSVEAWRAILSSMRGRPVINVGGSEIPGVEGSAFSRTDFVLGGSVDTGAGDGDDVARQYGGFRELGVDEINLLAQNIVNEIRRRGPFLNLAQFVNRRPGNDEDMALSGALQSAIDTSNLNESLKSNGLSTGSTGSEQFSKARMDTTTAGVPGWLMQGDILDPLGPSIVVRGDTFRIRAYGEARSAQQNGNQGEVLARAWCEAVVQRVPQFVDPSQSADTEQTALSPMNALFGRRYEIVQFRWLKGPEDV